MSGFLKSFSGSFAVAVGAWPFASLALTLPILALLYHRAGRIRLRDAVVTYLAVLYALGLLCFTLYPLPQGDEGLGITYGAPVQLVPFAFVGDVMKDGPSALFQVVANIALFVPLGFLAGRFLGWGALRCTLAGLAVSLFIETAQLTGLFGIYPYSYRTFDVDDLMTNTLGALCGFWLSRLLSVLAPPEQEEDVSITAHPGFVRRGVAFWIDMTLVLVATVIVSVVTQLAVLAFGASGDSALEVTGYATFVAGVLALATGQVFIPWLTGGQTPGGAFVRMTFETKPRCGWRRALFYAARSLTLALAFYFPFFALPALLIFYAIKKCMPYDLLP